MHGKRKDRGRKNLYTTTGVKRLCETVHIPRKREGERKEGWDSGERAGAHTHVYAYARQVCATASIWNDRETETWARRSEEERETGRGRREEQQRVVVGCCWRGQRESKTREQGNHMYLTWNLYMAANGWERSRVIVEGGRNVRRSYTHTHTHIRAHGPLLPTVARWSSRPYTLDGHWNLPKVCRKHASFPRKLLRSSLSTEKSLFKLSNLSFRIPGFAHSSFYIRSLESWIFSLGRTKRGFVWNRNSIPVWSMI